MELRNLITFTHVAELGSFTKAAEQLGYSQSTISFQIKQLEEELDCLLFERINHTITLTERGHELVFYAHQIRELTDEFKETPSTAENQNVSLKQYASAPTAADPNTAIVLPGEYAPPSEGLTSLLAKKTMVR